jgi:hypothetical protein
VNNTPPGAEVDLESQDETKRAGQADVTIVFADDIELPTNFDEQEVFAMLDDFSEEQYHKAEDNIVRTSWPKFEDLQGQLLIELKSRYDLDNITAKQFIQHAAELRENFWESGGRMSPNAYKDIYLARVLLEYGYQRFPTDMTLIDEFVETLQSAWPYKVYSIPPKNRMYLDRHGKVQSIIGTFDKEIMEKMFALRQKQFALVQNQKKEGYKLTFQDFLRVNDLIRLYRYTPGVDSDHANEQGLILVNWLLENAQQGGWDYYQQKLKRYQSRLTKGRGYAFTIFITKDKNRAQFDRRLPSFRGPKNRNVIATKDLAAKGIPLTNVVK